MLLLFITMLSLEDIDRQLVDTNGAAILIGGRAFDREEKMQHEDTDLLLFRGDLAPNHELDLFVCRQLVSRSERCWVNRRAFALDFDLVPAIDELPRGLWLPNPNALQKMIMISPHLCNKYQPVQTDGLPVSAPSIKRGKVTIPVEIITVSGDTRSAFSQLFDLVDDYDQYLY